MAKRPPIRYPDRDPQRVGPKPVPRDAAAMLGHWHRVEGPRFCTVEKPRPWNSGYPLRIMSIDGFARRPFWRLRWCWLMCLKGRKPRFRYHGGRQSGVRPMFGENKATSRRLFFDFRGDLYGKHVSSRLSITAAAKRDLTARTLITQMMLQRASPQHMATL